MKKTTVYEDAKKKKAQRLDRHTVACPYCGTPVLDHMTQCPHCKKELTPAGYQPLSDQKIKKIRIVTYSIGAVVTVAIIVLLIVFRK